MILLKCGIKKNGTNGPIYKTKQSHGCRKQKLIVTKGEKGGGGVNWDGHIHTTIYKIDS